MSKTVNYTPEMEEVIKGMYLGVADQDEARRDEVVEEIGVIFNKGVRSVRAKLSRMDIYIAKKPASKVTGGEPAKKLELAEKLTQFAKVNPETMAKANKTDLVNLIAAFETLTTEPDEIEED